MDRKINRKIRGKKKTGKYVENKKKQRKKGIEPVSVFSFFQAIHRVTIIKWLRLIKV